MREPARTIVRHRRGAIFIAALGIVVVLSGLLLVFAQNMRTEALASANRLSYAQADAVEQGAERWVLAQVESNPGDAVTITQTPAEALQIGTGYFWVLHPDPDSDQIYAYGITDEAAKLNVNSATSDQMLLLPSATNDIADAIVDWRDEDSTPGPNGAESEYYQSLPEPYSCKNAPFETVEELLLVKDVNPQLLYGYDRNHDGVISDAERSAGGTGTVFNSATDDSRGLFNYVTVYSMETNSSAGGTPRVNVNANPQAIQKVLSDGISQARANEIMQRIAPAIAAGRGQPVFANIGTFYLASGMTAAEFKLVADKLTTNPAKTITGLVNVNTAPKRVLRCLSGLSDDDVDALVAKRVGADTGSVAWIFDALPADKAAAISGAVTARSSQYSADIVAVAGDGRAYKRVRIVVDVRQTPAKIIYRKDLTALGWPLPREIQTSLRSGKGLATSLSSFTGAKSF